ncbi:MAG: nickel pincer cofactor biosynthesis protein LarC [Endomicrobium sp.]|jgi:uncharacterized protein (TIGR00299 family) protein|nr:nickel pincer cofactor biosynthesis protein LarC [Endomicrobium sp.]
MKTLYIDCSMGAAGDMIMAALFELIENKQDFLKQINSLNLPKFKVLAKSCTKQGVTGTRIIVNINNIKEISKDVNISRKLKKNNNIQKQTHLLKHYHTNFNKIEDTISSLNLSKKIKNHTLNIYNIIAQAESKVHAKPINKIHFHELGNIDAIIDIIGICMLMEIIKPQKIIASPINMGSGFVKCSHGILPVPVPATTSILTNIPIYASNISGELCTPTGAAVIKYFAKDFLQMPNICIQKIGYGLGSKDFKIANYLRIFLGKTKTTYNSSEYVAQLQCNLDDMTGEALGFTIDLLMCNGALDVFIIPVQMKKSRPGFLLTCICEKDKSDFFAQLIFNHTTTFGIRKSICNRYTLNRKFFTLKTPYGKIRSKIGKGYNTKKLKLEYNDIAKIAFLNNMSFNEVSEILKTRKK